VNSQGLDLMPGGKKEDPRYAQLSGHIPKELALRFKAECALQSKTISTALEEAVQMWMAANTQESAKG